MSRVHCHYKLPLFISKDVRSGLGTRRPCSEYIIEPSLKRCSIADTPNIEYPSAKNRKWVHCYPCDHWYCPTHASSARNIQHDNCRITARKSVERRKSKRKDKPRVKPDKQALQTKEPKKQPFSLSKARVISPFYEKEIPADIRVNKVTLVEESPPPIMRTFSTQTDEEVSDTETEALNSLNALNSLYLELQSNYDTLNSKYTILKTLGPALNSANKRKISELHSENSTLISEKEELSTDIQRLLDQIEKLACIIAENLHHIQDIESQRDALTEWFPNALLRKLILEKVPVTAPKLEELSPKTRNPLFNH